MKEDEKKKLLDDMDKLKGDIAMLKIKYLNQNYENETLIITEFLDIILKD